MNGALRLTATVEIHCLSDFVNPRGGITNFHQPRRDFSKPSAAICVHFCGEKRFFLVPVFPPTARAGVILPFGEQAGGGNVEL